jgi:hypothetical protein
MPTTTITLILQLDVPEGTTVSIAQPVQMGTAERGAVERYFSDYLSDNGRRVFRAAAELDARSPEPYSLEAIAEHAGIDYASIQSMHRSTGRTAKRWEKETGTPAPFRLEHDDRYEWDEEKQGMRTTYRLDEGVADAILAL